MLEIEVSKNLGTWLEVTDSKHTVCYVNDMFSVIRTWSVISHRPGISHHILPDPTCKLLTSTSELQNTLKPKSVRDILRTCAVGGSTVSSFSKEQELIALAAQIGTIRWLQVILDDSMDLSWAGGVSLPPRNCSEKGTAQSFIRICTVQRHAFTPIWQLYFHNFGSHYVVKVFSPT